MIDLRKTPVRPDVHGLKELITLRKPQPRVHVVELFQDWLIQKAVAESHGIGKGLNLDDPIDALRFQVELQSLLGYDMIRIQPRLEMSFHRSEAEDTTEVDGQKNASRGWQDESTGPIGSWEEFETYPWPRPEDYDYSEFEWAEKNLPEGMGVYTLTSHILEWGSWLMGYETMCYKMFDEPDLVEAVFQRVGELSEAFTKAVCDLNCVSVVWGSDDMGFKGGTLISPADIRKYVLPWHASAAQITHDHSKMYWLHSCGQLSEIMPDLIEDVRIDAKHSWEDTIQPVEDAYAEYGAEIGVLGGMDVDFLCRSSEAAIRQRVRRMLDLSFERGGYCLGTGNSVANYIPLENYLIMLDEGRRYGNGG